MKDILVVYKANGEIKDYIYEHIKDERLHIDTVKEKISEIERCNNDDIVIINLVNLNKF